MAPSASTDVTTLLRAWTSGDEEALEKLSGLVHAELHRLARRYMASEKAGHTLQPTALINEAWLRLIDWRNVSWQNRAHFFGVSAQMMRRILVDHVRRRPHLWGGEAPKRVSVDNALEISPRQDCDLLAVDDALESLAKLDSRKAQIVELRFFGGLEENEIAEVLQVSSKTIQREWIKAKAWLYHELNKTGDS